MKSFLLSIFLCFASMSIYAQAKEIGGTVSDKNGNPLPGVTIVVKNTSNGASTDFDGNYTISNVKKGDVLVFSYIGFATSEVAVNDSKTLNVQLSEDTQSLDEVVVVGYGTQKKREVTGAVSVVGAETLEALKPVKMEQALQGTVSGVNVTTTSGAPGADINIRIRGIATNGDNKPLTIIDGYIGDLSLLNPNDVETITVLKDAQAAIYGSTGANGVILITTKMGRKNAKTKISFNTYYGFQETSKKINLLNATEYAALLNETYASGGDPIPYPNLAGIGNGTDWQGEVFETAPIVNYDMSISGGSETMTYAISGSHLDQEGIVGGGKSGYLRNTARISLGADISKNWKLKTNVIYTHFDRETLPEGGNASVLLNAVNAPPVLSPYNTNGDFTVFPLGRLGNEMINPLAQIANTHNAYNFKKLNGNFGLDWTIIEGLVVSGSIGFNTANSKGKNFSKIIDYGGKVFDVTRSQVNQNAVNDNDYSVDVYATYSKLINDKHNIVATLGNTTFKEWGNGLYASGYDIPNNSWKNADISLATGAPAPGIIPVGSYTYDERKLSYFARVQYDYKGKYLLSGMIRRDASTKFGPGNEVGYFPSFTGGWIISDEGFFGDSKVVDFLKIRASYGTLGNDRIPNNGYISQLSGEAEYVFDGNIVVGTATGQIPNPNLKWEEARKFDVGADLKLLGEKINIVADYFIDTRADLLIPQIPVSGIIGATAPGASSPTINAGTVRNSGIEFSIDYKNSFSDDFSMSVGYNVTFLKNEVTEINGTEFIEGGVFSIGQPAPSRMEVGQPIGYFYGYKTDGIFQNQDEVDAHPSQIALGAQSAPGDFRYVDTNNDNVIDANDRVNIGDPIPDATMGLNIQFNYKALDFTMYTFASIGNDMVRNYESIAIDANQLNYVLGRWTGEGTTNSTPRVTTAASVNNVFSDYYVEDASFARIQNIQLGYSFKYETINSVGIDKLRLYASINNLYTFTKYRGFDAGASSGNPIGGGIDDGFYPIPRTYMLGLNINF
ncbi:TonB-dependent receptor [Lutibacter sp. HS1-25]|uniref:SusC/RagA family TonB-linked outer membrane protein n=1 Tax=Lutibacter sp. HS1-25 TaxID=2485000 RepID=UPI001012D8CB|nr:TonB-dependent receptor [Lutibacter sp. HS1-25]RXP46498.1 TonB-dependent receptor [Lutibacter sp. HS1-25]